jgi:thioredoxin reductase (NADPH)
MNKIDVAIIGGGPAGLTAGIYSARGGQNTVIFEKGLIGGQIVLTAEIENYPGHEHVMSGFDLTEKMRLQALKFGVNFIEEEIIDIQIDDNSKIIKSLNNIYECKAIIYSGGAYPSKLGVEGEERLTGRGVSYCATCDGALYRNKVVAMVGGGDSAVEEAIFLTRFVNKVYLIHRRDQLRAVHSIQQKALKNEKIEILYNTVIEKILGKSQVSSISLNNVKTNAKSSLEVQGIFIYIGIKPNIELIKNYVETDETGFVITDELMQTKTKGLYVVGDVRKKTLRQVVTATSDGAIAAFEAEKFLNH